MVKFMLLTVKSNMEIEYKNVSDMIVRLQDHLICSTSDKMANTFGIGTENKLGMLTRSRYNLKLFCKNLS